MDSTNSKSIPTLSTSTTTPGLDEPQMQSLTATTTTTSTSTPVIASSNLTPEQEEEIKLRSKYPNPQKPGGSSFVQKMLHKGNKKYFDSGDYNMAKSKNKAAIGPVQSTNNSNVNNRQIVNTSAKEDVQSYQQQQQQQQQECVNDSPNSILSNSSGSINYSSPSSINNDSMNSLQQNIPIQINDQNQQNDSMTSNCNNKLNSHSYGNTPTSTPNVTSPLASNNIINQVNMNTNHLNPVTGTSILMNTPNTHGTNQLYSNLDSEEIGHGIPTPECLQSRKHTISQSKLATPRLSTS